MCRREKKMSRPKNAAPGFLEEMIVRECERRELDSEAALELHAKFKAAAAERGGAQPYPKVLDPRYPNHNQVNHCWARYNEYLLCLKETEGDDAQCWAPKFLMRTLCPKAWVENWTEQREGGVFPGVQAPIVEGGDDDDDDE
jgi:cytochrome c oxidase subunit 6b